MAGDPLFDQAVRGSCGSARVPEGQYLAHYRRLREAGALGRYLVVEYRCADRAGCVMARVFTTPSGTFLYRSVDACSPPTTAVGRAGRAAAVHRARTETAFPLPEPSQSVELSCDHVHAHRAVEQILAHIGLAHRRGCPTGRRIGLPGAGPGS